MRCNAHAFAQAKFNTFLSKVSYSVMQQVLSFTDEAHQLLLH